ncbi:RNA dependent RNA polymerase-domain-containing protein [Infundibulicybe gibba]|nr:RNA dependent RNA polymerase-domain-containing protein [Infundibulicybe gibba]
MDLGLAYIPGEANNWTVTRAIAEVLHSEEFASRKPDERVINFRVRLNPSKLGGLRNDGTGTLTVPSREIGGRLLRWIEETPIRIGKKKIRIFRSRNEPHKGVTLTLAKTPYINPDLEEEREKILWALQEKLRVNAIQVGMLHRSKYPSTASERLQPRSFSVEWEHLCVTEDIAWLQFEYDHKLIRIVVGNSMVESTGSSIEIKLSSMQKIGVGYDSGNPYVCFDIMTPPVLEEIDFHRSLTGERRVDEKNFKRRIGSLHPGHELIAPYAYQLRITLCDNDPRVDIIGKFVSMCQVSGLSTIILNCEGPSQIEARKEGFFSRKRIYDFERFTSEIGRKAWSVAFQLEALVRDGYIHTGELLQLQKPIRDLCRQYPEREGAVAADVLRRFSEALQSKPPREDPIACFHRVYASFVPSYPKLARGNFYCCHVTFAPTRMILEGPFVTQSNRIIRLFPGFENHFIRVEFREEDQLQYRWDRQVDVRSFLRERVGGILKNGFQLAGRNFEFLAYSTSALREHAVWFMNPFQCEIIPGNLESGSETNTNFKPGVRWITADFIRRSIGDFKGDLLQQPSKYAARLAQAFTATDPSVQIKRSEWKDVDDLKPDYKPKFDKTTGAGAGPEKAPPACPDNYIFTDGVGTISKSLGDRIWQSLCESRRDGGANSIQPSAYQIRFLGYKGVVGVDQHLDENSDGILMRLRPSMKKFDITKDIDVAEIEIAQAFENPNTFYLNRPLIMLLEDRGVRKEVFLELQNLAVARARTIHDSLSHFCDILREHSFGNPYHLSNILRKVQDLGLDLGPKDGNPGMDDPFFHLLRQVAMTDVLRDIKHYARIQVPKSWLLVGIADEGPTYVGTKENVYVLPEAHIYGNLREPTWIEGNCTISRSPVAHPGDGQFCHFAGMKNVVVLHPLALPRLNLNTSLYSDMFAVILNEDLLPSIQYDPASYISEGTFQLERDCDVDDICDFIIEYIHSDVLGLLSDRLLIIAGMYDEKCLELARLCSQAVDYPKQGIPVDLEANPLPSTLIRCKPDWHAAEVAAPHQTDYYESSRALGYMYRAIELTNPEPITPTSSNSVNMNPLADPISVFLRGRVEVQLDPANPRPDGQSQNMVNIFRKYSDELRYICIAHALSSNPADRLSEAEIVIGTILAKSTQKRLRSGQIYRIRLQANTLVRYIQGELLEKVEDPSPEIIREGLEHAWEAWILSKRRGNEFGAQSFGLIALGVVFDCLNSLEN